MLTRSASRSSSNASSSLFPSKPDFFSALSSKPGPYVASTRDISERAFLFFLKSLREPRRRPRAAASGGSSSCCSPLAEASTASAETSVASITTFMMSGYAESVGSRAQDQRAVHKTLQARNCTAQTVSERKGKAEGKYFQSLPMLISFCWPVQPTPITVLRSRTSKYRQDQCVSRGAGML